MNSSPCVTGIASGTFQPQERLDRKSTENRFSAVSTAVQKICEIDKIFADNVTRNILPQQKKLAAGRAVRVDATDLCPFTLIILNESIHIVMEEVGEGTFCKVLSSVIVPTAHHKLEGEILTPGKPLRCALKMIKKKHQTFTPEKKKLDEVTKHGCADSVGIDHSLCTFKDQDGYSYSVHPLYTKNLSCYIQDDVRCSVASIIALLISCSKGLESIHLSGHVHRDVKGANFLVAVSQLDAGCSIDAAIAGVITDFGTLNLEASQDHTTIGTLHYLDPSMFGSLENCLLNQKMRYGRQTKQGDVFALGITFYRDVLLPFIKNKSTQSAFKSDIEALIQELIPTEESGHFTEQELKERGNKSSYRTMCTLGSNHKTILITYPAINSISEKLRAIFVKLSDVVTKKEVDALIELTELSCEMQLQDLSLRPSIHTVIITLEKMMHSLQEPVKTFVKKLEEIPLVENPRVLKSKCIENKELGLKSTQDERNSSEQIKTLKLALSMTQATQKLNLSGKENVLSSNTS